MPRCYLLAVCNGSSLDRDRNTFSLYNLVEQVGLGAFPPVEEADKVGLPFEVHSYWQLKEDERGVPFEFRLVREADGSDQLGDQVFDLASELPRQRVRITGLPLPGEGQGHIEVEWRRKGSKGRWTRESIKWPLDVTIQAVDKKPEPGAT